MVVNCGWVKNIVYNVLRLNEDYLTETLIFAQISAVAFTKPLLPTGWFISRNLN